jgi:hypothetical protein
MTWREVGALAFCAVVVVQDASWSLRVMAGALVVVAAASAYGAGRWR